jgi:hypothetical protein
LSESAFHIAAGGCAKREDSASNPGGAKTDALPEGEEQILFDLTKPMSTRISGDSAGIVWDVRHPSPTNLHELGTAKGQQEQESELESKCNRVRELEEELQRAREKTRMLEMERMDANERESGREQERERERKQEREREKQREEERRRDWDQEREREREREAAFVLTIELDEVLASVERLTLACDSAIAARERAHSNELSGEIERGLAWLGLRDGRGMEFNVKEVGEQGNAEVSRMVGVMPTAAAKCGDGEPDHVHVDVVEVRFGGHEKGRRDEWAIQDVNAVLTVVEEEVERWFIVSVASAASLTCVDHDICRH